MIRIGYLGTLVSAIDVVAVEEKLYEKANIRVTANKFDGGRGVRDAMVYALLMSENMEVTQRNGA